MIYTMRARQSGKWVDILTKSNSIAWGSDKDTLAVDLSFNSLTELTEGTILELLIDSRATFMGSVIEKNKTKNQFSYICQDFARVIGKNETIIQFNKISGDAAIKQLCAKFGVKVDCVVISTLISKIYKDFTLADIIADILEQAELEKGLKYIKEMRGDTLYIRKLIDLKIYPLFILSKDLEVNSSIEEMKNKILVVSSDEDNNRILANVSDPKNINTYGSFQEVLTVEAKDISKAKNIASNRLKEANRVFKSTSLSIAVISNCEEIKANRLISLKVDSMGLNGWYSIKSCSNILENGLCKSNIVIEW
ncbi:XkdQ/YqbQ family protein [Clostridium sp.]|jgi:hypothetical protein|uniref:XkdQ/YqbQ family protein n=1 Tax=Clostridium sp. TaxID=1506 RepID=UPI003EEDFED6